MNHTLARLISEFSTDPRTLSAMSEMLGSARGTEIWASLSQELRERLKFSLLSVVGSAGTFEEGDRVVRLLCALSTASPGILDSWPELSTSVFERLASEKYDETRIGIAERVATFLLQFGRGGVSPAMRHVDLERFLAVTRGETLWKFAIPVVKITGGSAALVSALLTSFAEGGLTEENCVRIREAFGVASKRVVMESCESASSRVLGMANDRSLSVRQRFGCLMVVSKMCEVLRDIREGVSLGRRLFASLLCFSDSLEDVRYTGEARPNVVSEEEISEVVAPLFWARDELVDMFLECAPKLRWPAQWQRGFVFLCCAGPCLRVLVKHAPEESPRVLGILRRMVADGGLDIRVQTCAIMVASQRIPPEFRSETMTLLINVANASGNHAVRRECAVNMTAILRGASDGHAICLHNTSLCHFLLDEHIRILQDRERRVVTLDLQDLLSFVPDPGAARRRAIAEALKKRIVEALAVEDTEESTYCLKCLSLVQELDAENMEESSVFVTCCGGANLRPCAENLLLVNSWVENKRTRRLVRKHLSSLVPFVVTTVHIAFDRSTRAAPTEIMWAQQVTMFVLRSLLSHLGEALTPWHADFVVLLKMVLGSGATLLDSKLSEDRHIVLQCLQPYVASIADLLVDSVCRSNDHQVALALMKILDPGDPGMCIISADSQEFDISLFRSLIKLRSKFPT